MYSYYGIDTSSLLYAAFKLPVWKFAVFYMKKAPSKCTENDLTWYYHDDGDDDGKTEFENFNADFIDFQWMAAPWHDVQVGKSTRSQCITLKWYVHRFSVGIGAVTRVSQHG